MDARNPLEGAGGGQRGAHAADRGCLCEGCLAVEILQHATVGVVVLDLDARAVRMINAPAREALARLGLAAEHDALLAALVPLDMDLRQLHGAYSPEPLRLRGRVISYTLRASPPFAWAFVQDVTEKERMESIAFAVETMNTLGFLFSALRHELGNPVNSVKAALSVLEANLDRVSRESVLDYIDRIRYEVRRVEHLLRSMKSFSMYDRPERARVPLRAAVEELADLVSEGAASRGIRVETACADGLDALCDPRVLQQVLLNLFANAADAVLGRPSPAVRLSAEAQGDLVVLRMSDNGHGLSKEQLHDLFRPFHSSKEDGTGLGLVISRKMLARMEGTITLESVEGEGTTVVLTLPRCPSPA